MTEIRRMLNSCEIQINLFYRYPVYSNCQRLVNEKILALIIGEYILEDFSQFESLLLAQIGTGWFPICISQVIAAKLVMETFSKTDPERVQAAPD